MRFILPLFLLSLPLFAGMENLSYLSSSGKKITYQVESGKLIVRLDSDEKKKAAVEKAGYKIIERLSDMHYLVSCSTGLKVSSAIDSLAKMSIKASPNKIYGIKSLPNDTALSSQYYLSKISAYSAWEYETGFNSLVTIAVIDSGISAAHSDLSSKIHSSGNVSISANGLSGPAANDPPTPACYHGSAVAGAAAAATNNAAGIAGVSWGAKLLSVKIFNDSDCDISCGDVNSNGCVTSDSAIIKAVSYLKGLHGNPLYGKIVANLSLGGAGPCDSALQAEINDAYSKGMIFVASAGNDSSLVNSPANCANVIPVSATDENDSLSWFSSRGDAMLNGVAAPGENIYTCALPNTYANDSGTSFSAPIVSGVLALMWSYKPALSNSYLTEIIKKSADDLGERGPDSLFGWGRVNAFRSILFISDNSSFSSSKKITAFPSPFSPSKDGVINFYVPQEIVTSEMKLYIYDFNGDFIAEVKNFSWNGKNASGIDAASGAYIVLTKTDKGKASGKFLLLR